MAFNPSAWGSRTLGLRRERDQERREAALSAIAPDQSLARAQPQGAPQLGIQQAQMAAFRGETPPGFESPLSRAAAGFAQPQFGIQPFGPMGFEERAEAGAPGLREFGEALPTEPEERRRTLTQVARLMEVLEDENITPEQFRSGLNMLRGRGTGPPDLRDKAARIIARFPEAEEELQEEAAARPRVEAPEGERLTGFPPARISPDVALTSLTRTNREVFQSLSPEEQRALRQRGFRPQVTTTGADDFPAFGSRDAQVLVNQGVLVESARRGIVPGSEEFGGGLPVQDVLEHEQRHELLRAEGIPDVEHHDAMQQRGGRWVRGLEGHRLPQGLALRPEEPPEPPTPLQAGLGILEAERELFQPVTGPIGRRVGEEAARAVTEVPGGRLLEAAGVPVPRIPGAREAGAAVGEAVAEEALLPSNLVPIPIVDPLLARAIGLGVRGGQLVTRAALSSLRRPAARLATESAKPAVREAAEQFVRQADEVLAEVPEQGITAEAVQPPPPASQVPLTAQAVPEGAVPPLATGRPAAEAAPTVRTRTLFGEEVDTFATERERAGIRERQGTLLGAPGRAAPVPEGQVALPTERAPLRGLERETAQIAEERTLAQEALTDPRTGRIKGESARLRTSIESLNEQERIIQDFRGRGLTPDQMADELAEMALDVEKRTIRTERGGRGFAPAFGTAERTEFELARRGRRPPSQRQRVFRPSEAEGEAIDELAARLGIEEQVNERAMVQGAAGGEALTAARVAERRVVRQGREALQEAITTPGREGREAWRLWDGANKEAALNRALWRDETYRLFDDADVPIARAADDQADEVVEIMEGVFGDETARGKVGAFRPAQREAVRALYERLDETTQRLIAADPDFELKALPEYFPHQFKVAKPKRGVGARGFQLRPGFLRQRKLAGALGEILESRPDLDLATWDPVAYVDRHIAAVDHYINSLETIRGLKAKGLIASEQARPPANWRRPDIAPFKLGQKLQGWVAEPKVARTLDEMFGKSAFDQHGVLKALKTTRETAFRIKVFGGLFQQIDYSFRGAGLGLSELARGNPRGAVQSWFTPLRAVARSAVPSLDRRLSQVAARNPQLRALYRNGLSAGVDPSIADRAIRAEAGALRRLPGGRGIAQVTDFLGGEMYERFHREMLEQAGLVNLQKNLRKGVPMEEAARQAVEETNVFFSSIPNWQSAVRSKTGRDLLKFPFFATGELEGWFRLPFQAPAGFAGLIGAVVISAEMLNKAFTGEWLSEEQLIPYQTERPTEIFGKKLPVGFNHQFLRPKLPWKGGDGRDLYLDLLGQADTPFRWAFDPQFALQTRLGQFPRLGLDLQTIARGETPAFSEEIEGPADIGRFAAQTISPIGVSGLTGSEVERIGVLGGGIQASGLNISAQSRAQRFGDLYAQKHGVRPNPDISPRQLDPELAQQAGYGGETDFQQERTEIVAGEEGQLAELARIALRNPQAAEQFDEEVSDFFRFRAGVTETLVRDLDLPERQASLVQEWYDLDPRERRDPDTGEPDWDGFFAERERILGDLRAQGKQGSLAARALEEGKYEQFSDPDLQRAYDGLREAKELRREYHDIVPVVTPSGEPVPEKTWDEVQDFYRQVQQARDIVQKGNLSGFDGQQVARLLDVPVARADALLAIPPGSEVSPEQMIRILASEQGRSEGWIESAVTVRPGTTARTRDLRNPALDDFLRRHQDTLVRWFPDLYPAGFFERERENAR